MKKIVSILSAMIFAMLPASLLCACGEPPEPATYRIIFNALDINGGYIEGNREQIVKAGENSEKVVAVANPGYYFAGWADLGSSADETVTRQERIIYNVQMERAYVAIFEKITVGVRYVAGENGDIEGELIQSVKYGEDTQSVTAVPCKGYRFVGWSDGVTDSTRSELDLRENKQLTADFELIVNTYKYDYKFADEQNGGETVTLAYGRLDDVKLAVPKREHATFGGWYADKYLTKRVADENGNILADDDFLYENCERLYAKWNTQNHCEYKVLMVYITEVDAWIKTKDGKRQYLVDYTMSDTERRICNMITEKMEFELNDLAVADFVVDEYFTTEPITNEQIATGLSSTKYLDTYLYSHTLWAYDIPEIQGLLKEYDSVLVSYSATDSSVDIPPSSFLASCGETDYKFGTVHIDWSLADAVDYGLSLDDLLNPTHYYWNWFLREYLDQFTRTVTERLNSTNDYLGIEREHWNEYTGQYWWNDYPFVFVKQFLTGNAELNQKSVGVPYEFWEGKYLNLRYGVQGNGHIYQVWSEDGQTWRKYIENYLPVGAYRGTWAVADEGYEFVGWSDGVQTENRPGDSNINKDLCVYAIFEPIE